MDELLQSLDRIVARHDRGDRSSAAAEDFWTRMLTSPGHPLNTSLPDEPLIDWHERGLLGDLDGAHVLDIGCGNGRNAAWLARQGAQVTGIDIAAGLLDHVRESMPAGVTLTATDVLRDPLPAGPFDLIYDSGCFHHIAPHRRITYLEQVSQLGASGSLYAVVTFAEETQPSPDDLSILTSGDTAGGMSFTLKDLESIFEPWLVKLEARAVRTDREGAFGAEFLNAGLYRWP